MSAQFSLGIDIGGTFTDVVACDHAAGREVNCKVLTTHDDPSRGVMLGVERLLAQHALDPARFGRVVHATTLFTNALIERKGAVTGLVTTAGFRDTLEIGRERKYELYDLNIESPRPLVPRNLRLEVDERTGADGSVVRPLDAAALDAAAAELVAAGAASIAIVFLHSYANPAHEREAATRIEARFPGVAVTTSHEVAPEIREFERASTTAANAYIKPLARRYLQALADRLAGIGIRAPLLLMLSNGGLTHVAEASRTPVQLLESGPAAGALAAAHFGREDGDGNLLAFDMGGTTAKLSLIDDGRPLIAYGFEAARQKRFTEGSGLPIRISTIELIEIGAGGGSIAHLDEIGLLKVGPQSAGSEPGPACYGLGGTEPTVTDANLVLGYLNPDWFAGGTMRIDAGRAHAAVAALAGRLGITPLRAAWGIHDVANENMAAAARVHIAERGRDPRHYSLLTTGGGGPVHGYYVAKKLALRQLVCPPSAGVASAFGLLVAPARIDRMRTISLRLDGADLDAIEAAFAALEAEARTVVEGTGTAFRSLECQRFADGRYVGQGFYLVVDLPAGPYTGGDAAAMRRALTEAFEKAYREKFARTPPDVPIEFVNIRVAVSAAIEGAEAAIGVSSAASGDSRKGLRRIYYPEAGDYVEAAVHDRGRLAPGAVIDGPAVIEEDGSTLVIGPGGRARVAASGNIVVSIGGGA